MLIDSAELWFAQTNTYVVALEPGSTGIVVDAPPDVEAVCALLARHEVTPVALLLTHGHVDHMGAAGGIEERFELDTHVHPDDDFLTLNPLDQVRSLFGMVPPGEYRAPLKRSGLVHGTVLDLAGIGVEVRHTPGHTPGHCCFFVESQGVLFSGDQLFAGSIGRTDLPGGDVDALARSMATEVMTLDDDVTVFPGHGPATTVGRERHANPFRELWAAL